MLQPPVLRVPQAPPGSPILTCHSEPTPSVLAGLECVCAQNSLTRLLRAGPVLQGSMGHSGVFLCPVHSALCVLGLAARSPQHGPAETAALKPKSAWRPPFLVRYAQPRARCWWGQAVSAEIPEGPGPSPSLLSSIIPPEPWSPGEPRAEKGLQQSRPPASPAGLPSGLFGRRSV